MKKRLISLALVLVLALSLLPVAALAADYDDFTDLKENVWYTPYINFVLEKGYFKGMSETEFAPNGTMTRAMFVTVIARMEGAEVDDNAKTQFEDVKTGVWYTGSVAWAAENKIVEGYEDGSFRPGNYVTRNEMAAIMTRYIDWRIATTGDAAVPGEKEVSFADQAEIDKVAWAKEAVAACAAYGLLEGYPDGTFGGKRNSTRAEVSAVIERLDWIIHGKDHIYRAVLNITNSVKENLTKTVVKAEDLSAEYKDYIASLDKVAGDIKVADYVDAALYVGENVNGTRVVTAEVETALNENMIYNLVRFVATYAVTLYGQENVVTYEGVKEIVDAVIADVDALDLGFLTDMEAAEIAELVYSTVRGKVADVWTANFKGAKGYYTGDITVKVGDYSYVIVVDEETGVSFPEWKQGAVGLAKALVKEVAKSFVAQAKDYTSSLTDIGAVIDITFSAGAYKEDTDLYAYNYPVDASFSFVNGIDMFQYKVDGGLYLKAYFSNDVQAQFKTVADAALTKIMESEAFNEKFNPAVEEVKESQLAPVIDVLAKGDKQDEESANKTVDTYIEEWAKTNAEAKLTGDGQWNNESIYNLATLVGLEVSSYVESELDAKGLAMKKDITPAQLKDNMVTAGVEFDVDPALENYVLAVICDQVSGEDKYAAEDSEATAAMKQYVDETLPAALEDNEDFNKALELAEKVRTALESVDNLCAVRFGNLATVLRNETVQDYLTYEKTDNLVARFAKYIEKVPAKAAVTFAGCTLNEEAVIAIKDAESVADVCNILADILEETGLADLTLADFAPEAGQDLVVSYGDKSVTLVNLVVEFEK